MDGFLIDAPPLRPPVWVQQFWGDLTFLHWPVDPASVRVFYRRQPPVDITERIKPFITPGGIDAPSVVVPTGNPVIEIEATDKEGRIGRRQLTLTVAPQ